MSTYSTLHVRDVDFTAPGPVDPADFGLDGLLGAAARLSVDLSPTSGLGASRLVQVRRMDGMAVGVAGRSWFQLQTSIGAGALVMDASLAVAIADLLLGGLGVVAARPLTSVEERVVAPHLQRALDALSSAFSPAGVSPITVSDPGRGAPALRGDFFVVDIAVGANGKPEGTDVGVLSIVVPAPVPTRRCWTAPTDEAFLRPGAAIGSAPLLMSARTQATLMPADRVRALGPGDVVLMRHKASTPLTLSFGPVDVAYADLGQHDGGWTVHVLSVAATSSRRSPRTTRARRNSSAVLSMPGLGASPTLKGSTDMNPTTDPDVAAAVAAAEGALHGETGQAAGPAPVALGALADIPVEVSVEVGRASVSLREAAELTPGQVIALDAAADAPALVLVNGRPVARGQVVVVDDVYGVRISELIEE